MTAPAAPPLLEIRGASKSFPGVKALDAVDLDLYPGEVLALIGENGAGKSTLMKLLSGVYSPDAGEFFVDGQQVTIEDTKRAEELGIAIIHQEFNLIDDLTVAQNIYLGREPRRGPFISDAAMIRDAQALFDRLGLALDPRATVGDLTVAAQQMVEIAKALSVDARILIMDEPTAALNDEEVATLHQLIRQFAGPDTGVIYISHRMPELKAISQRTAVLRDGRYIGTVSTAETETAEVIRMMVGREIDTSAGPDPYTGTGEAVLEVVGLSTKDKLRDIDLELRAGEILGLAGLMGAGRTELARAIVGADRTSGGRIMVGGRPVRIQNPARAAALGICYLSEDRKQLGIVVDQSVRDNVALPSLPRYFRRLFADERAIDADTRTMVERLNIRTPSIRQEVGRLSGGNQQKVAIAKWLVRDCDVFIFDEPTRGIDVGAKAEIYRLLRDLSAQGKSIIVISSELPEVLALSQRIAVMSEGRLAGVLDGATATQDSIMELATRFSNPEEVVA
ncbi:sugar ABC transporter ATP-binding protein [Brevibacterium sp. 50QC2O2]|uniref:sugar ABC transporter ATP-binding protein n=1 Tax=Brevibacterium sp. 50QC2O2 TaxID=2968459 RepID=UPI00211CCA68|nr:sugar ABC transporter ATP-binding protein [Brevibacterium sp. 50QC2O2]MCQ9388178.1 sugar ABC transporter ATP-binding protein [Brevibacterium sp. 50QC2O2]